MYGQRTAFRGVRVGEEEQAVSPLVCGSRFNLLFKRRTKAGWRIRERRGAMDETVVSGGGWGKVHNGSVALRVHGGGFCLRRAEGPGVRKSWRLRLWLRAGGSRSSFLRASRDNARAVGKNNSS